jgi:hypothetical protein
MRVATTAGTWVLCAGALALCSCRGEAARQKTLEALTLSAAIQALRQAPHDDKTAALARLRALQCVAPRACEAKEVCVQAYSLHQKAIDATREIRTRLASSAEPPASADQVLAGAANDLQAAKAMMQECLQLETALVVETRPQSGR